MGEVDVLIQFAAVGIGAFLGFLSGMLLERWRKDQERKGVLKAMINSFIRELDVNKVLLKNADRTKEDDSFDPKSFLDSAFQTSVNTGNFYLLGTTIQQQLQGLYSNIKRASKYEDWIVQLQSPLVMSKGTPKEKQLERIIDSMLSDARNLSADSVPMLIAVRGNLQDEFKKLEK